MSACSVECGTRIQIPTYFSRRCSRRESALTVATGFKTQDHLCTLRQDIRLHLKRSIDMAKIIQKNSLRVSSWSQSRLLPSNAMIMIMFRNILKNGGSRGLCALHFGIGTQHKCARTTSSSRRLCYKHLILTDYTTDPNAVQVLRWTCSTNDSARRFLTDHRRKICCEGIESTIAFDLDKRHA